jgi:hypothetical protein
MLLIYELAVLLYALTQLQFFGTKIHRSGNGTRCSDKAAAEVMGAAGNRELPSGARAQFHPQSKPGSTAVLSQT